MAEMQSARVLVLEDDKALSEVVCEELRARGCHTVAAHTVADGFEQLKQWEFDVALLDLILPDGSGIELLRHIAQEGLPTESIVLTGYAAVSTAIEAMKLGAYDYLTKPARMEELEVRVAKAAEKARLRRENLSLRERLKRQDPAQGLVTEDPAMKEVLATVARVAPSDIPVLIQGESGTGKELIARAIHEKSPRAGLPFLGINCAAVPESLLESELFGHEKGAFTGAVARKPGLFELADRGVLLLDEVGEAPLSVQVKLLRVLETKEFLRVGGTRPVRSDVRILSATNKNLKVEMQEGRFREDLYYRLNGITLQLPSLRNRREDIPLLARHFVDRFAGKKKLSPKTLELLKAYAWPGNVRELSMAIQRAVVLCAQETIEPDDLPLDVRTPDWKAPAVRTALTLAEMEREYIATVLEQHQGHRGKTARALGIDPKTLYNKLSHDQEKKKDDSEQG
jgi:two-component system response regulator AtoC